MSGYAFDATAPIIRYVSASASGSANGTSIGSPWTWSQLAAGTSSQALNGADVWFTGDATISTPLSIGSGNTGFEGRPLRLLAYNATPGDLTGDVSDGSARPTLTYTGGDYSSFLTFSRPGFVLFGCRVRTSNEARLVRGIQGSSLEHAVVDACDLQGGRHPDGIDMASDVMVMRSIVSGNDTALSRCSAVHSFLGARGASGRGNRSMYANCVLTAPILAENNHQATRCFVAGLAGLGEHLLADCLIAGPFGSATNKRLLRGAAFRESGNTVAQAIAPTGYSSAQELAASPVINRASGDLRLTANGRTNRRCVETMLGLVNVPLPSGWLRDDAATLYRYLAEVNGYGRATSPLV
jgi:hypothetical protein